MILLKLNTSKVLKGTNWFIHSISELCVGAHPRSKDIFPYDAERLASNAGHQSLRVIRTDTLGLRVMGTFINHWWYYSWNGARLVAVDLWFWNIIWSAFHDLINRHDTWLNLFNENTSLVYHLQAMPLIKSKQPSKNFKNLFKQVLPHSPLV